MINKFIDIGRELDVREPSDWGRIGIGEFMKNGGTRLKEYYRTNSVLTILRNVIPGYLFVVE